MSNPDIANGFLAVMTETFEGGRPGQGTMFLDRTQPDGSGSHGLLAVLDSLSAAEASAPTPLGTSVASHAAHVAFHLEVCVRWVHGDHGPFDWPGSFEPRTVDDDAWRATRSRVRKAYDGAVALVRAAPQWDEDATAGFGGMLAHAAYHLGAIGQVRKLARKS